jgi:hypothetical protein
MRFTLRRMMTIVAGIAGANWLFDSFIVAVGDGHYDLAVSVQSTSTTPIRAVSCEAFGREKFANDALVRLQPPEDLSRSDSAVPFTGQKLSVSVLFTDRISPMGRIVSDFQFSSLLVIVTYSNGRRTGKVVPNPHRDVKRTVMVIFP